MIDEEGKNLNLRGLLQFKKGKSIPLDEVESVDKIVQRLKLRSNVIWLNFKRSS